MARTSKIYYHDYNLTWAVKYEHRDNKQVKNVNVVDAGNRLKKQGKAEEHDICCSSSATKRLNETRFSDFHYLHRIYGEQINLLCRKK